MKQAKSKIDSLTQDNANAKQNLPAPNQIDQPIQPKTKKRLTKKIKLILICSLAFIILLATAAVGYAIYLKHHRAVKRTSATVASVPAKPKKVASPLSGELVDEALAKLPVVAVVIENLYPNARPQSGLSSAGVVYEALAEGGITRYLAFYQADKPADLGPVRSIRTYFVSWALGYDSPVVHAGGNIDALDEIGPLKLKNLDEFASGSYFRRITSRFAPHNLYISGDKLKQLLQDKSFNSSPTFTPWPRKDDAPNSSPTATTITIDFSYFDYQAKFVYDASTNSYKRFVRDVVDTDANTNAPIQPKNVVVMQVPTSFGVTRIGEQTVIMQTVGSGKATIFIDGVKIDGSWQKTSHNEQIQFVDASGQPISLNRGQTWVCVIPLDKTVTVQ